MAGEVYKAARDTGPTNLGSVSASRPRPASSAWPAGGCAGSDEVHTANACCPCAGSLPAPTGAPPATSPPGGNREPPAEEDRIDLSGLLTGALPVHKTSSWPNSPQERPESPVQAVRTIHSGREYLAGAKEQSHPGQTARGEVAAGKKPEIPPLALAVPADQYFVLFHSPGKLLETIKTGDLWGGHLINQSATLSLSQETSQRLLQQLAIPTDAVACAFYDTAVGAVVMTGSDLYFREGTDVTLLMEAKRTRHSSGLGRLPQRRQPGSARCGTKYRELPRRGLRSALHPQSRNSRLFELPSAEPARSRQLAFRAAPGRWRRSSARRLMASR